MEERNYTQEVSDILVNMNYKKIIIEKIIPNPTGITLYITDNGTEPWSIIYLNEFYVEMYRRITEELGPDVNVGIEIGEYNITGGVEHAKVNVMSSFVNIFPAFVRHQFVLPVSVKNIPVYASSNHLSLPEGVVERIDNLIKILMAQRNVPKTFNHRLKMLRRGVLNIKTVRADANAPTFKVSYELPSDCEVQIAVDNNNNYRMIGILYFPLKDTLKFHILDSDDFKDKIRHIPTDAVKSNVINSIYSELGHHVQLNKLVIKQPSHEIMGMFKITGDDGLLND